MYSTHNCVWEWGLWGRQEGEIHADVIWSSEKSYLVTPWWYFSICYQNTFENLEAVRGKRKTS